MAATDVPAGLASVPGPAFSPLAAAAAASDDAALSYAPLRSFPSSSSSPTSDILSVAPMMEWTNRNYRFLARLLTRRTLLYTEMLVTSTLIHSPLAQGYLRFHPAEHPIACQLGGSDPDELALCAKMVEDAGYDEVNLNCGCPSPRVAGKGAFGAALMFTPEVVRDCVAAMRRAVTRIPVTVKCRLGADKMDSYEEFKHFVEVVASGGCEHFILHARKCLLKGLDPRGNRTVPPLKYEWVQRIALEMPHVRFSLNGGVTHWDQVEPLLALRRTPLQLSAGGEAAAGGRTAREAAEAALAAAAVEAAEDEAAAAARRSQRHAQMAAVAVERSADLLPPDCGCDAPIEAQAEADGEAEGVAGEGGEAGRRRRPSLTASTDGGAGASGKQTYKETCIEQRAAIERVRARQVLLPPGQFAAGAYAGRPGDASSYGTRDSVLDSIMIGRAAYNNSWTTLADADRRGFGVPNPGLSRREVLEAYLAYTDTVAESVPAEERCLHYYKPLDLVKPLVGLFNGEYGGSSFRKRLFELAQKDKAVTIRGAVAEALKAIPQEILDERAPVGAEA